jgi:hypothetical protein
MSKHTKAVRTVKKFPTFAALIKFVAEGTMTADEVEELIDAVAFGEGLKERDRQLAEVMEAAPPSLDKDPLFAAGVSHGYQCAIEDVRAGIDITQAQRLRGTFELLPPTFPTAEASDPDPEAN